MNLGIVCQRASTGGVRYAINLAIAIRSIAPQVCVTLHHGQKVIDSRVAKELLAADVRLNLLGTLPRSRTPQFFSQKRYLNWPLADRQFNAIRVSYRNRIDRGRHARLAKVLNQHDVVHFTWPYALDPPPLRIPASFIPHDFIHTHEFGVPLLDRNLWESSQIVLERWLQCATPIVSSDFVAGELRSNFPDYRRHVEVIYLSSLHVTPQGHHDPSRMEATCRRLGVTGRYILCPNNVMPHKNLSLLISALWHLRQAGENVRLVVVGLGTEGIRAKVNCPLYGDRVESAADWDILGLGVVGDDDLLDLMRQSELVVNPSLCEAGAGSGLDAWGCGCAVALSDIPAFRDQVRYLGTRAEFFDPRDPRDTARVLLEAMRDQQKRAADGEVSRAALQRYDWSEVARRYLAVFERLVGKTVSSAAR